MLADYHMHTEHSSDSKVSMKAYAEKAIADGFDEICFTDHVDYDVAEVVNKDPKAYYADFKAIKSEYEGRLNVKFGMEFGIQAFNTDKYKKLFKLYPFDFILLSCHDLDKLGLWNKEFQKGKSQKEVTERYFEELLSIIRIYDDYSVLGHLDLIRRYDDEYQTFKYARPILEEILRHIIKCGKGLEVNTSCFRYNIPDLTPAAEILKLYRNFGGEILTIGSDAHNLNDFGYRIKDVHKMLSELGFEHFYTFDNMLPQKHDLSK